MFAIETGNEILVCCNIDPLFTLVFIFWEFFFACDKHSYAKSA